MSRITQSLYRVSGVELNESNNGHANISLVQNLFDEAVNKGLFKEAKKIVEDRNIIVDSDGLKVTPTSACTGAYIDLKKLVFNESLNEAMKHDFIKIYKTSDSIPNDAWDFPIEELDHVLEEHPGESFVLSDNRLYEIGDESLTKAINLKNEALNELEFKKIEQGILELQKELKNEKNEKRRSFLQATINRYKKQLNNKSLNESSYDMHDGSLRDEFYSLIEGMDPQEVISWLLSYMNDYDLDELIRDARKYA